MRRRGQRDRFAVGARRPVRGLRPTRAGSGCGPRNRTRSSLRSKVPSASRCRRSGGLYRRRSRPSAAAPSPLGARARRLEGCASRRRRDRGSRSAPPRSGCRALRCRSRATNRAWARSAPPRPPAVRRPPAHPMTQAAARGCVVAQAASASAQTPASRSLFMTWMPHGNAGRSFVGRLIRWPERPPDRASPPCAPARNRK